MSDTTTNADLKVGSIVYEVQDVVIADERLTVHCAIGRLQIPESNNTILIFKGFGLSKRQAEEDLKQKIGVIARRLTNWNSRF